MYCAYNDGKNTRGIRRAAAKRERRITKETERKIPTTPSGRFETVTFDDLSKKDGVMAFKYAQGRVVRCKKLAVGEKKLRRLVR